MKKLNVILVYNHTNNKILMCKREKDPYKGKLNLVGGKVEPGENDIDAAYRELQEETGIKKDDIELKHILNIDYFVDDFVLEIYAGKLNKNVKIIREKNPLLWVDKNDDFYNEDKYAGEGNLWHIIKRYESYNFLK